MSQTTHQTIVPFYIGIDFHKHYSVFCVIDDRNTILERGRIDHKIPIEERGQSRVLSLFVLKII